MRIVLLRLLSFKMTLLLGLGALCAAATPAAAQLPGSEQRRNDKPAVSIELSLSGGLRLTAGFVGPADKALAFAQAVESAVRERSGSPGATLTATIVAGSARREPVPTTLDAKDRARAAVALATLLAPVLERHGFVYADPPFRKPGDPYLRPRPTPPPIQEYRFCGTGHAGCHEWETCNSGLCTSVCGQRCAAASPTSDRCPRDLRCVDGVCFHQFCPPGEEGEPCPGPIGCASGLQCRDGKCGP